MQDENNEERQTVKGEMHAVELLSRDTLTHRTDYECSMLAKTRARKHTSTQ